MLSGLSIRNVVLIESLDLSFDAGLTALTGETGAGKSIILDALGMATGARSDRGLLRSGADNAACTASFELSGTHPVWEILKDAGLECDLLQDLTLRRTMNKEGRSRAFINDAPVNVKLLANIGEHLLEVHGQHDGRGLLDPSTHIDLLDLYGRHQPLLAKCSSAFEKRQEALALVMSLKTLQAKAVEDRDFLEFAIAELDRLDPRAGEDEDLADKRRFLQGAEGALAELTAAQDALGEEGVFESRLATALAGIERVKTKIGTGNDKASKALDLAGSALEKAMIETTEARAAVHDAVLAFDIDPGQLDMTEQRLFALRAAARKYNCTVDQLVAARSGFAGELDAIDNVELDLSRAKAAAQKCENAYAKIASGLTKARLAAGKKLDAAVVKELPPLKMERAVFMTVIEPGIESAKGVDKVRFQVATNPGTPSGPLEKIASGGELARFALAIKVALAGANDAVMVFDEVDQGVGGAVADAVGRRLATLSETAQVFVVTHSPQVAAKAGSQFLIQKSSAGKTTTTHVQRVADNAREEEIARMLAGEHITNEARAAARQLIAS